MPEKINEFLAIVRKRPDRLDLANAIFEAKPCEFVFQFHQEIQEGLGLPVECAAHVTVSSIKQRSGGGFVIEGTVLPVVHHKSGGSHVYSIEVEFEKDGTVELWAKLRVS